MTTDPLTTSGAYLLAGGFIGFVVGYALKKVLKWVLVALGLIFAFLIYLQYKGWIEIKWPRIQTDLTNQGQQLANQTLTAVNQTAHQMSHASLNTPDALYPILGVVGFIPGLLLGFMKG